MPRDMLLVHSLPFVGGIKSSAEGVLTLPKLGWGRDLQEVSEKIRTLKKRYEEKYPELRTVEDNIFEAAKFLIDRPNIVLEPNDERTLFECIRIAGSELPDISLLADNIVSFLEFFDDHFEKKLRQTS